MAHENKFSTSLPNREMQTKMAIRYHYIPSTLAKIKNSDNAKCW